jgi:hypothetical protein
MSSLMESNLSNRVPGLVSQWLFHAFTTILRFGCWVGLLYCACQWVPVAWKIAVGH